MKRDVIIGMGLALLGVVILLGASFTARNAAAQQQREVASYLNDYVEALRQDVQTSKRRLITWNMGFTEAESEAFWPVYRRYEYDLDAVNSEMVALVRDYSAKGGVLTDEDAGRMLRRRFDIEQRRLDVKRRYVSDFRGPLPGPKVAKFYQVDKAIDMLIDIAVMSELPFATSAPE
jgi:hypothetical protein